MLARWAASLITVPLLYRSCLLMRTDSALFRATSAPLPRATSANTPAVPPAAFRCAPPARHRAAPGGSVSAFRSASPSSPPEAGTLLHVPWPWPPQRQRLARGAPAPTGHSALAAYPELSTRPSSPCRHCGNGFGAKMKIKRNGGAWGGNDARRPVCAVGRHLARVRLGVGECEHGRDIGRMTQRRAEQAGWATWMHKLNASPKQVARNRRRQRRCPLLWPH